MFSNILKTFSLSCIFFGFLPNYSMFVLSKIKQTVPAKRFVSQKTVIDAYDAQRDKDAVNKIAIDHIYALVSSPVSFRNRTDEEEMKLKQGMFNISIQPGLVDENVISKICKVDNETIGFINYCIFQTWRSKFLSYIIKHEPEKRACIHHLAIDNQYKKQGYGTLLLNNALEDCKKQKVTSVFLWTTGGSSAGSYYRKQGFSFARQTKLNEEMWEKKLQDSVALTALFLNWLCKLRQK